MGMYTWISAVTTSARARITRRNAQSGSSTNIVISPPIIPSALPAPSSSSASIPPKLSTTATEVVNAQLTRLKLAVEAKKNIWPAPEHAVAVSLAIALSDPNYVSKSGFENKEPRAIIQGYIEEWNNNAGKRAPATITRGLLDQLEEMFSPVILTVANAHKLKDPEHPVLILLKKNKSEDALTQDVLTFEISYQGQITQAANVVQINQHAEALSGLYKNAIDNFETFKQNPDDFLTEARASLDAYYKELLKINADQTKPYKNHWGYDTVQKSLGYYFEQRQYLYKIYSETRVPPEPTNVMMDKMTLMDNYKDYLLVMFARPHEYNQEFSFTLRSRKISFHPNEMNSRSIKILAALDQYYALCPLPGDTAPPRNPDVQENINYAGENGRLGELKRQGMTFFKNSAVRNAFTPLGVFGDIEASSVKRIVNKV